MLLSFASGWWPFTITIVSLAGPFLFKQLRAARREEAADDDEPRQRSGRPLISLLLLLNSIYILYRLLLEPPPNLFASLRIPFTTPAPTIRALLLQRADPPADFLSPQMELLLTKLASFEVRTMYSRCVQPRHHHSPNSRSAGLDTTSLLDVQIVKPFFILDYMHSAWLYSTTCATSSSTASSR